MARYRLRSAHYLVGDKHLLGDTELGEGNGTIVGDGTDHIVRWPTLEMEPLDEEAETMVGKERERLERNQAVMNPIDELPLDNFEKLYVPGTNMQRGKPKADGEALNAKGR